MLVAGLLLVMPAQANPAVDAVQPSPAMCRVAADKIAPFIALGRGMLARLDEKGVPPERRTARDSFAKNLDADEARVLALDKRYAGTATNAADEERFHALTQSAQKALLKACAEQPE